MGINRTSDVVVLPGANENTKYLLTPVDGGLAGEDVFDRPQFIATFTATEGSGVARVQTQSSGGRIVYSSDFSADGLTFEDMGPFDETFKSEGVYGTLDSAYRYDAAVGDGSTQMVIVNVNEPMARDQWVRMAYECHQGSMNMALFLLTEVEFTGTLSYGMVVGLLESDEISYVGVQGSKESGVAEMVPYELGQTVDLVAHTFTDGINRTYRLYVDGVLLIDTVAPEDYIPEDAVMSNGFFSDVDGEFPSLVIHKYIVGEGKTLPSIAFD